MTATTKESGTLKRANLTPANLQSATLVRPQEKPAHESEPSTGRAEGEFVSSIPYERAEADCLVFACSSHHFEKQTRELLAMYLGFQRPHVIQFPAGAALVNPLVGTYGYLSKTVDLLAEKAANITKAKTIICVAHENCSGYENDAGRVVDFAVKHLTGGSVRDLQISHLRKAKARLQYALKGTVVRAFFADVIQVPEGQRVKFTEIR